MPGPARMSLHVVSVPGREVDNAVDHAKPENVAVPVDPVVETGRNWASRQVLWLSALATCLRKQATEFDLGGQLFKLPSRMPSPRTLIGENLEAPSLSDEAVPPPHR